MNDTIETIEEKKDKGFTLIELLIVIVILGILATVTVFAVGGITDRGGKSACKAEYKTIEVAIEAFVAQSPTGAQPANVAALTTPPNNFLRTTPSNYSVNNGAIAPLGTSSCLAPPAD